MSALEWGSVSEPPAAPELARRDWVKPCCEMCGEGRPALLLTVCFNCDEAMRVHASAAWWGHVARAIGGALALLALMAAILFSASLAQIFYGRGL